MIPEPTHDHAFPPTRPARVPGDPRHLQVAKLYTRADAITDGLLVPVPPKLVDLYRLPWPLAVTATAWADAIDWPPSAHQARPGTDRHHESVEGRLADVLFMVKTHHEAKPGRAEVPFTLWRVAPTAPIRHARPLRLTLTIHPGESGEPVATLAHTPPPRMPNIPASRDRLGQWSDRHTYLFVFAIAAVAAGIALALLPLVFRALNSLGL